MSSGAERDALERFTSDQNASAGRDGSKRGWMIGCSQSCKGCNRVPFSHFVVFCLNCVSVLSNWMMTTEFRRGLG
jgi:hypothetical protein